MWRETGRMLLDAFAPRHCAGCDGLSRVALCTVCCEHLLAQAPPRRRTHASGALVAGFEFAGPARAALHRGKFRGDQHALRALARLTWSRVQPALTPADGIVAVPLGARRRRQRGYNQAEVIAAEVASQYAAPLLSGLLRTRETQPQAERDESARRHNVDGAFRWSGRPLAGAHIWLVDDVVTTGATAAAAVAALNEGGSRRVDVIAVALVP